MRRPVIGIVTNTLIMDGGVFPGQERFYINQEYVTSLEAAGGAAILLPALAEEGMLEAQLDRVDGVLLSGGYDVNPLEYGEEPLRQMEFIFPELDRHHMAVARMARKLGKPLLGICRGLQIMNVAFGGTLYQDLACQMEESLKHFQRAKMYVATHSVDVVSGTRLADILGTRELGTNSFHHQAVKDVAPGFRVNSRARDGVIEGIEAEGGTMTLAVQWHPEMMAARHPVMGNLFCALVEAAQQHGGGK